MADHVIEDGFHDVPPGRVATVVTHLEMRAKPAARPVPDIRGLELRRHAAPSLDWYRDLFRQVGAEWLWFSRLVMADNALAAILADDRVHVMGLYHIDQLVGLLELDFRDQNACELAYFGLMQTMIGGGAGRWMMTQAIDLAFAQPIERFHVHTCTLDSPAALPFYIRSGFTPLRQQIEIAPDPRLAGHLPRHVAQQIPIFDAER